MEEDDELAVASAQLLTGAARRVRGVLTGPSGGEWAGRADVERLDRASLHALEVTLAVMPPPEEPPAAAEAALQEVVDRLESRRQEAGAQAAAALQRDPNGDEGQQVARELEAITQELEAAVRCLQVCRDTDYGQIQSPGTSLVAVAGAADAVLTALAEVVDGNEASGRPATDEPASELAAARRDLHLVQTALRGARRLNDGGATSSQACVARSGEHDISREAFEPQSPPRRADKHALAADLYDPSARWPAGIQYLPGGDVAARRLTARRWADGAFGCSSVVSRQLCPPPAASLPVRPWLAHPAYTAASPHTAGTASVAPTYPTPARISWSPEMNRLHASQAYGATPRRPLARQLHVTDVAGLPQMFEGGFEMDGLPLVHVGAQARLHEPLMPYPDMSASYVQDAPPHSRQQWLASQEYAGAHVRAQGENDTRECGSNRLDALGLPAGHEQVLTGLAQLLGQADRAAAAGAGARGEWRGLLVLTGPAGVGKRSCARAVADLAGKVLYAIDAARLVSKVYPHAWDGRGAADSVRAQLDVELGLCRQRQAVLLMENAEVLTGGAEDVVLQALENHAGLVVLASSAPAEQLGLWPRAAALGRIAWHLALPRLAGAKLEDAWARNLGSALATAGGRVSVGGDGVLDLERVSRRPLTARQVRHVCCLAVGMASTTPLHAVPPCASGQPAGGRVEAPGSAPRLLTQDHLETALAALIAGPAQQAEE